MLTALLDHVVVILDGTAYQAARNGSFLSTEFARVAVKESESSLAGRYTATAVIGTSTLVELFDAAAPPLPGIGGGLVLSFEVPGSMPTARSLLTAAGVEHSYELVRRTVEGEPRMRPWYHLVRPDLGAENPFLLMITEVTADYYHSIGAVPGPGGVLHRRGYLDARLDRAPAPAQLLRDVTGLDVRLRPERAARLRAALTALGFAADGPFLRGPDSVIRVDTSERAPEGVLALRAALTRANAADRAYRFGETSTLTMLAGEESAEWRFTPPTGEAPR